MSMSLAEQRKLLDQIVLAHVAAGFHLEHQTDDTAILVRKNGANHMLHLVLTLLTCALWLVVWLFAILGAHEIRRTIHVASDGAVFYDGIEQPRGVELTVYRDVVPRPYVATTGTPRTAAPIAMRSVLPLVAVGLGVLLVALIVTRLNENREMARRGTTIDSTMELRTAPQWDASASCAARAATPVTILERRDAWLRVAVTGSSCDGWVPVREVTERPAQ